MLQVECGHLPGLAPTPLLLNPVEVLELARLYFHSMVIWSSRCRGDVWRPAVAQYGFLAFVFRSNEISLLFSPTGCPVDSSWHQTTMYAYNTIVRSFESFQECRVSDGRTYLPEHRLDS